MLLHNTMHDISFIIRTLLVLVASLFSFDGLASVQIGGKHSLEVKYYPINRTDSLSELNAEIDKQARKNGLTTDAATDTSYNWSIKEVRKTDNGMCKIAQIDIHATTVILLPDFSQQVLSQPDMDSLHKSNAELLKHEFEHYRNHQQAYAKMLQMLTVALLPCDTLGQSLKAKIKTIIDSHINADSQIDTKF